MCSPASPTSLVSLSDVLELAIASYQTTDLASYPGSLGEGKKRAWYLLFAHALKI